MADVLDRVLRRAIEYVDERTSTWSGGTEEILSAIGDRITDFGGVDAAVSSELGALCARAAVDIDTFYDAVYALAQRVRAELNEMYTDVDELMESDNGIINWYPASRQAGENPTVSELEALLAAVRRGRWAKSVATEVVSEEILAAAQAAAAQLAAYYGQDDTVAVLPTAQEIATLLDTLEGADDLRLNLSGRESDFAATVFAAPVIYNLLNTADLEITGLIERISLGEDVEGVGAEALAAAYLLANILLEVLRPTQPFGDVLSYSAELRASDSIRVIPVTLTPLVQDVRGKRATAGTLTDGVLSLTGDVHTDTWFRQELLEPTAVHRWFRLGVATGQRQVVAEGTAVPVLPTEVAGITSFVVTPLTDASGYIDVDDASVFTSGGAYDETWLRVGTETDGYLMKTLGFTSTGVVERITIDKTYDAISLATGAVATWAAVDAAITGFAITPTWHTTQLLADYAVAAAGVITPRLSLQLSGLAATNWPASWDPPSTGQFAVGALGFGASGSPAEYFGIDLATTWPSADILDDWRYVDTYFTFDYLLEEDDASTTWFTVERPAVYTTDAWAALAAALPGLTVRLGGTTTRVITARVVEAGEFTLSAIPVGTLLLELEDPLDRTSGADRWLDILSDSAENSLTSPKRYEFTSSVWELDVVPGDTIADSAGTTAGVFSTYGREAVLSGAVTGPCARYRYIRPGDVVLCLEDTSYSWRVDSLTQAGPVLSPVGTTPTTGLTGTFLFAPPGGTQTSRFLVREGGTKLDLFSLEDRIQRAVLDSGYSGEYPSVEYYLQVRGRTLAAQRVDDNELLVPELRTLWSSSDIEARLVARTSRDGRRGTLTTSIGPAADRAASAALITDLVTDNRTRFLGGTVPAAPGTETVEVATPVRLTQQGPIHRGGHPLYGRWAYCKYLLDTAPGYDLERTRADIQRAFADLGTTGLAAVSTIYTGSFTPTETKFGTLVLGPAFTGLADTLLWMDVVTGAVGESPTTRPRIVRTEETATAGTYEVYLNRHINLPLDVAYPTTEIRGTTITSAMRELGLVRTSLLQSRDACDVLRPPSRRTVSTSSERLTAAGFPEVAELVANCEFSRWPDPSEYGISAEDLAEEVAALLELLGDRTDTPL
jgi:hypothetical protein